MWADLSTLFAQSLCIKIRGTEGCPSAFRGTNKFWPETVKSLKLEPVICSEALDIVKGLSCMSVDVSGNFCSSPSSTRALQKLSLFLDVISDKLVITIAKELPHLVELGLEDMPVREPLIAHDLANIGLQSLGTCRNLKSLSCTARAELPSVFRKSE